MAEGEDPNYDLDPSWDGLPGEVELCLNGLDHGSDFVLIQDLMQNHGDTLIEDNNS